jgi:hypothetical protein
MKKLWEKIKWPFVKLYQVCKGFVLFVLHFAGGILQGVFNFCDGVADGVKNGASTFKSCVVKEAKKLEAEVKKVDIDL